MQLSTLVLKEDNSFLCNQFSLGLISIAGLFLSSSGFFGLARAKRYFAQFFCSPNVVCIYSCQDLVQQWILQYCKGYYCSLIFYLLIFSFWTDTPQPFDSTLVWKIGLPSVIHKFFICFDQVFFMHQWKEQVKTTPTCNLQLVYTNYW